MLISTLDAYFQGKKELFGGLAIEALEKEWKRYPVLHLDLNIEKFDTEDSLNDILNRNLVEWESLYGSDPAEVSLSLRFAGVVKRACLKTGMRTVILVDEYDKPLLQAITNPELQDRYRNMLKPFYGVLKTMDGYIKFALLTGVTKFGKISVFSDLNNLDDISRDNRYIDICGITEKELQDNFSEDIRIRLHHGVQARRERRAGHRPDRGEAVRPAVRQGLPQSLHHRCKLLVHDKEYRQVDCEEWPSMTEIFTYCAN